MPRLRLPRRPKRSRPARKPRKRATRATWTGVPQLATGTVGVLAAGLTGREVVRALAEHRRAGFEPQPETHVEPTPDGGAVVTTPDGSTYFIQDDGRAEGNPDTAGPRGTASGGGREITPLGPSYGERETGEALERLTSPTALLVAGAVLVGLAYVKTSGGTPA